MTGNGLLQIALYFALLLALVKPLGWYMARVYEGRPPGLGRILGPLERLIYRACRIDAGQEMDWKTYAKAMLLFNLFGLLAVYLLQRVQGMLPFNPQHLGAVEPLSAFNTAVSFATNTNWQGYAGENTMSYFTQMAGLTVQNFLSAASGMAVLVALIRGIARRREETIGNFWADTVRGVLYILLPLSFILALALVSQGVVQTLSGPQEAALLQPVTYDQQKVDPSGDPVVDAAGKPVMESLTAARQSLPVGPMASQEAIKELGTNGGGFVNVNSAHPFENPTPFSNLLEMLAILAISAGLCFTFGAMVGDRRQGWALLAAMLILLVPLLLFCAWQEQGGNPAWRASEWTTDLRLSRRAATWRGRRPGSASRTPPFGRPSPRPPPAAPSTPCTTPSRPSADWFPCSSCSSARWCSEGWGRGSSACSCS